MRKTAILLMICLAVAGCLNKTGKRQQAADSDGVSSPEQLPTEEEVGGYPVKDREAEITELYVTDRQGIDAKQEPDENSRTLLHYRYGDALNVFTDPGKQYAALYHDSALYCRTSSGVTPGFYAVGGTVYREWRDDGMKSTVQSWRYELVFVKRSALGDMSQVQLIPEELNVVTDIWESGERTSGVRLTVELTDKSVYDSMAVRKVDLFSADTASIPKNDGRIVLKTEAGEVAFEDDRDDDIYYYPEGSYETPKRYVVSVQYEDCFSYHLIDNTTGGILDLSGFPNISPDRKYILCLYPLDTDGLQCAGMTLYGITDERKIFPIMESKYMNWGIKDQGRDGFWGPDGCFYCKARHSAVNWGNNPNCEYVRIRLSEAQPLPASDSETETDSTDFSKPD